jgi:hypothetical protein
MSIIFHELCARDERLLLDVAADDLSEITLLDRAEDELFRIAQEAKAAGLPAEATEGWGVTSNGVLAATAMALRTGHGTNGVSSRSWITRIWGHI